MKKILAKCVYCRQHKAKSLTQEIAPIPNSRLPNPKCKIAAFENTIIDAAGPFQVKQGRSLVKRYWIVFSCMVYRCIHIEVTSSLGTESFLMALSRFMHRRGTPSLIRTDNGGNFRKGGKEMQNQSEGLEVNQITKKYPDLKWEFSPPLAPHTNGAIERMIGSAKRALVGINTENLDEETFRTLSVKVEGILNNRPLTYLSNDPQDLKPLIPNNFLLPVSARELRDIPEGESTAKSRKLAMINDLQDQFWNRFIDEYVPSLNRTERWTKSSENIKEGEIVFLMEKNERGKFPLAIVEKVYPSSDGKIRSVDIKVIKSRPDPKSKRGAVDQICRTVVYRRHICSLIKLEPDV